MILRYFKDGIVGLWTAFLQWVINKISDMVFNLKKSEAMGLAEQYRCKYYVIQSSYFKWIILRAADIDLYKRKGDIAMSVNAIELERISAFIAIPKNYKAPEKVISRRNRNKKVLTK